MSYVSGNVTPPRNVEPGRTLPCPRPAKAHRIMTDMNADRAGGLLSCRFCGASPNQDVDEALRAMCRCTNCLVDLYERGAWTGVAWRVTKALVERHGAERVAQAAKAAGL